MRSMVFHRAIFFTAALAAALIAFLPLRLAVDGTRLAARAVTGSVWSGSVEDAHWGAVRIGDADAGIAVTPLLLGRLSMGIAGRGADPLRGTAFTGVGGAGISGVDGSIETGAIFAPLPLAAFELENVSAQFGGSGCSYAGGLVRARISNAVAGLALPQGLSGTLRCEADVLLVPLRSASGMEGIDLRIARTGRFEAQLLIRPADAAGGARLAAAGFRRTSRGYLAVVRGDLSGRRSGAQAATQ